MLIEGLFLPKSCSLGKSPVLAFLEISLKNISTFFSCFGNYHIACPNLTLQIDTFLVNEICYLKESPFSRQTPFAEEVCYSKTTRLRTSAVLTCTYVHTYTYIQSHVHTTHTHAQSQEFLQHHNINIP